MAKEVEFYTDKGNPKGSVRDELKTEALTNLAEALGEDFFREGNSFYTVVATTEEGNDVYARVDLVVTDNLVTE